MSELNEGYSDPGNIGKGSAWAYAQPGGIDSQEVDQFETARTRAIELTWLVVAIIGKITPDNLSSIMSLAGIPSSETVNTICHHVRGGFVTPPPHRAGVLTERKSTATMRTLQTALITLSNKYLTTRSQETAHELRQILLALLQVL